MKAIHNYIDFKQDEKGYWKRVIKPRNVAVLAIVNKYAMVRVKGGAPYVAPTKELEITAW